MKLTLTALMLLLLAAATAPLRAASPDVVNGIAALVGDSVITYEQVQKLIARTVESERVKFAGQPERFRQAVMEAQRVGVEALVQQRLILQEFKDLKVNIPETYIEDNIESEIKEKFGDRTTLSKTLAERGITMESFRREIRDEFIEAIMRNRSVPRDILISPARIQRYYQDNEDKFRIADQVKLRMIVIDKTRNPVDAVKLGKEILAKLDEGADFGEMASVYSDGSQAREGGQWGWVERKVLRDDLAELAFRLKPGQRSELIEKPEAVFLMLVEEVREAHLKPMDEVREEIERALITTERARLHRNWIEKLRKKSFVRYF